MAYFDRTKLADWPIASVCISREGEQSHVGIAHLSAGQLRTFHLMWHFRMIDQPFIESVFRVGVRLNLPERRLKQIAARCRLLWGAANSRRIPFGFGRQKAKVDRTTGEIEPQSIARGYTCATFTLETLRQVGVALLDGDTWPTERAGDKEWQASIVAHLENDKHDAERVAQAAIIKSDIGVVRIRPEEVAAAALLYPPTQPFASVDVRSTEVLAALESST